MLPFTKSTDSFLLVTYNLRLYYKPPIQSTATSSVVVVTQGTIGEFHDDEVAVPKVRRS